MRSVNRLTLDRELRRQCARLQPGVVLDVGAKAAPYRSHVPARSYLRLDIDPAKKPDTAAIFMSSNGKGAVRHGAGDRDPRTSQAPQQAIDRTMAC